MVTKKGMAKSHYNKSHFTHACTPIPLHLLSWTSYKMLHIATLFYPIVKTMEHTTCLGQINPFWYQMTKMVFIFLAPRNPGKSNPS